MKKPDLIKLREENVAKGIYTSIPAMLAEGKGVLVKDVEGKGLILLTAGGFGNVIRHLVPLIVTNQQLERGLDILDEAMAEMAN